MQRVSPGRPLPRIGGTRQQARTMPKLPWVLLAAGALLTW